MHTYASSRVKRGSFYRKSDLQMFLLISGGHIGASKRYTNMASPYKALQRCVKSFGKQLRNCGPETFSWPLPLDGFQFIFLLRKVETIYKTKFKRNSSLEYSDVILAKEVYYKPLSGIL